MEVQMARTYYTLVSRNWASQYDSTWAIEFGDYDRSVVQAERDDYRDHGCKARNLRIISSGDSQAEINAAVAALNAEARS
jgi:hypothetical protein